jgi:hypothetical protein
MDVTYPHREKGRNDQFIPQSDKGGTMKTKSILALLTFLLFLSPLAFAQSRETGAIIGTVSDQDGVALPGVVVTVTSPSLMGTRSVITESDGSYRFPALPPGDYTVKAELPGFNDVVRENIRLTTTTRLTVDFTLKPETLAEEVTVIGKAPTVDIKSAETASVTLSNEILRNIPYSQFTAEIVWLAPGVTDDNVAFGASSNTGIAYTMDGVNVADPEAGSAWVFLDHNIIEEAKVMGVGLPAEYGNFTGVIFNLITKSGGNQLSGHVEFDYQGKADDSPKGFWQSDNNLKYVKDFPGLTPPLTKLMDASVHLGGPIKKDRLWFYLGLQYYRTWDYPTGFPEPQDYKQPHSFLKLSSQLSPSTNLSASVQVDTYNGINRIPGWLDAAQTSTDATLTQKSPEVVGNFSLTHIISSKSFFDLKAAFFWGYYYLDPEQGMDVNGRFILDQNKLLYNSYEYGKYDRTRFQANASYTHYVEDFIQGSHDFKFGAEVERSFVRNRYGYTGANHTYYVDYAIGEPYLAYQYEGYDMNSYYTRLEAFVQDSWQITPRININAGLRFSQNWGTVKGVDGVVYNTRRLAPRVGFTFDLFGDKSTVLKGHYGQFTEAMLSSYFDRLNPASAFSDYISYYWDSESQQYVEFERIAHENLYTIAPNIKHPYMNQFTVGIERELFKDASMGVTFIYRDWKNIIGKYDLQADYEPHDVVVPDSENETYQIWQRTADTVNIHQYVLDNIKKGQPWITADPYRKYWGVEFLFNKRFSNRWQMLFSYIYSQATGTMDNDFAGDVGYSDRDSLSTADPNFWINADGHSTNDPTHMLKIQGTYVLPFDISFNAYFRAITGNAWTTRYRTGLLNQGRVTFFVEPRGLNHYPILSVLDLRLEKTFLLAQRYRLGVIFDVFNVFNANTIREWGTRIGYDWIPGEYPSAEGHELYSIMTPRQARIGIRLMF